MKKFALAVAALLLMLSACSPQDNGNEKVRIVLPNGAPAFVFSQMMSEGEEFEGYELQYEVVLGSAALQAKINSFDLAILPTNMAANLYNKGNDIKLVSVNVYGTLYLVGREEIDSLDGLKGKAVYNIGRGQTPDITFKHLLGEAGIVFNEDEQPKEGEVTLKYVEEGTLALQMLLGGQAEYAVIGEPQVTQAIANSNGQIKEIFNIQQLWEDETGKEYPQAGLVAKRDFLEKHPGLVEKILEKIGGVSDWLTESDGNRQAAAAAINQYGGQIASIAESTVTRSNLRTVPAGDAKAALEEYYGVLKINNGAAIGGELPGDDFYYIAE